MCGRREAIKIKIRERFMKDVCKNKTLTECETDADEDEVNNHLESCSERIRMEMDGATATDDNQVRNSDGEFDDVEFQDRRSLAAKCGCKCRPRRKRAGSLCARIEAEERARKYSHEENCQPG